MRYLSPDKLLIAGTIGLMTLFYAAAAYAV